MRRSTSRIWIVAAALTLVLCGAGSGWVWAQRVGQSPHVPGTVGQLWIHTTPLDDRQHVMLVVDPNLRNAAIYHVDGPSGALVLKSTRNITWDLMVGDFNAQEPKPSALRRMLEVGAETAPIGQNPP